MAKYEVYVEIKEFIKQFDIFGLCDTWGKSSDEFDSFLDGYNAFSNVRKKKYRKGRASGGVTVFVKSKLIENGLVQRIFCDLDDCVVLLIKGSQSGTEIEIILCFLYISPEGSPIYNIDVGNNGIDIYESKLLEIIEKYPNANLMVAGDFNARCGTHQDVLLNDSVELIFDDDTLYEADDFNLQRQTKDHTYNNFGLSLIELCKVYNIHMLNGRFPGDTKGEVTCVANDGSSIVDYFIASSNLFPFITDFEVCNRGESVHFPIACSLKFDNNLTSYNSDDSNEIVYDYVKFKWKDTLKDTFSERFLVIYNDLRDSIFEMINNNINECVQTIVKVYQTAAECMRIKGSNKNSNKILKEPWWDHQCEYLKKEKYRALRCFRRTNDINDLNKYKQCRCKFKDSCNQKKLDYQKRNREELIESRRNSNLFWKTVKKFRQKDSIPNTIRADTWVAHFKQLLFIDDLGNLKDNILGYDQEGDYNDTFNAPFTMSELRCSIRDLKLSKSGGPDGIIPEMITHTIYEMSDIFLTLFNTILETGRFPENWSNSMLCPIFKSGSTSDPNN